MSEREQHMDTDKRTGTSGQCGNTDEMRWDLGTLFPAKGDPRRPTGMAGSRAAVHRHRHRAALLLLAQLGQNRIPHHRRRHLAVPGAPPWSGGDSAGQAVAGSVRSLRFSRC